MTAAGAFGDPAPTRTGNGPAPTGSAGPRTPGRGPGLKGHVRDAGRRLRGGGPLPGVVSLLVIWTVFQVLAPQFLSPRNLSTLSVDIVGTGLIAVGIVFVLLLGDLDLSVASVSGLAAAVFAVLSVGKGVPEWWAVLAALAVGALVGAVQGFFSARFGVPAFVVTLAGLLAWNGLMLQILGATGTIDIGERGLVAALTSYRLDSAGAAYGMAALSTAGYFLASYRDARRRRAAGVLSRPLAEIVLRTAAVALVAFATAAVLERFQGVPLALLVFLVLIVLLDFTLRRMSYGRKILALGGGREAAYRAGINVALVRISVFAVSGTLAAIGGLFLASRVGSVGPSSGSSNLLINAIAAAVIGGASLFGGRGSPWSALLGMLVIQSIASGMLLMGVAGSVQYMITGGVLLAAVVLDSLARRSRKARGRS